MRAMLTVAVCAAICVVMSCLFARSALAQTMPSTAPTPQKAVEPEDVVRQLCIAMALDDASGVEACILPNKDSAILRGGKVPSPIAAAILDVEYRSMKLRRGQVGETIMIPSRGGKMAFTFTDDHVNENRQQIIAEDGPFPFIVVRVDGVWRVDASPLIAARKAAAVAQRAATQHSHQATTAPADH